MSDGVTQMADLVYLLLIRSEEIQSDGSAMVLGK